MPNHELSKSIEAKRLNKRSRLPLPEPPGIIPFGAIVGDVERDGDLCRFTYLGELYQCPADLLDGAIGAKAAPASFGGRAAAPAPGPDFRWQEIRTSTGALLRAKVPGGWMVAYGSSVAFYPDPDHSWDGTTLA